MNTPHDRSTGRDGTSRTGASPGDPNRPAQGASNAGDAAKDVTEQLKSEGKAQVDQYRDVAADKIDTLADSVKAAASKLEGDDDVGHLSGHIADMASSMSQLSDGLRNKSADQILHDVSRIARENPALFVAGSIAVGFGLTRFARASAQGSASSSRSSLGSSAQHGSSGSAQGSTYSAGSSQTRAGVTGSGNHASSASSDIPGMASHPATSGDSAAMGAAGTRPSNSASPLGAAASSSASGTGTSYSTGGGSSINDASLGTGAGSSMATGPSRDPDGRDAGGGSAAAPGALNPSSAPYNTTPEQSNGRKPS